MRIVLDTNVLASGALDRKTPPSRIVALWRQAAFEHVTSNAIIAELARTFESDYFRGMVSRHEIEAVLGLMRTHCTRVDLPAETARIASHPEDDLVLATAVAGAADYLVTGDRRLLALGEYQGTRIVSPAEFLALLDPPGG